MKRFLYEAHSACLALHSHIVINQAQYPQGKHLSDNILVEGKAN
jgi:hypothetical protein